MTGIKALNILSLHGKGGNAITFERKLEPIVKHFKAHHFHFLDGPYILSKDRARLNTEKRDMGKNDDNITDRAWWTLPDGVRSFEATSYEGNIIIITIITIITFNTIITIITIITFIIIIRC